MVDKNYEIYNEFTFPIVDKIMKPILEIAKKEKLKIFQIDVIDLFTIMLYCEKQEDNPDKWDCKTLEFTETICDSGLNIYAMLADEDYGPTTDVIILYNDDKNGLLNLIK